MSAASRFELVQGWLGDAVNIYQSTLNVYYYRPRMFVPPAAIVEPREPTIDYPQANSSPFAKWYFYVTLVIGDINEQASLAQAGQLVSPESPLIAALNNAPIPNGFAQVIQGAVSSMSVQLNPTDSALYTTARLLVTVMA